MTKREANVFTRLKNHICRPEDRFDRIENGLDAGWPDVNYCFVGREGWIELKAPELPAREDTPLFGSSHKLSVDQSNWFLRQHRAGGRGFLFVATRRGLLLIPGERCIDAKKINTAPLAALWRLTAWSVELPVGDAMAWVKLRGMLSA